MKRHYTFRYYFTLAAILCCHWQLALSQFNLSGIVHKETGQGIASVSVSLTSPGYPVQTTITDAQGRYTFPNIEAGRDVTITAARNDNHRNGVSILDMVKIHRHLMNTEPFNSPYKLIAADVNGSQALSALDLVELRKLILGLYSVFPHSKSWKFLDADFDFSGQGDPAAIEFTVTGDITDLDFIGVKIGDVTNNAQ